MDDDNAVLQLNTEKEQNTSGKKPRLCRDASAYASAFKTRMDTLIHPYTGTVFRPGYYALSPYLIEQLYYHARRKPIERGTERYLKIRKGKHYLLLPLR